MRQRCPPWSMLQVDDEEEDEGDFVAVVSQTLAVSERMASLRTPMRDLSDAAHSSIDASWLPGAWRRVMARTNVILLQAVSELVVFATHDMIFCKPRHCPLGCLRWHLGGTYPEASNSPMQYKSETKVRHSVNPGSGRGLKPKPLNRSKSKTFIIPQAIKRLDPTNSLGMTR